MRRCPGTWLLLTALVPIVGGCTARDTAPADRDAALAGRIERLVDTFLTSDDDGTNASVLSEARAIFESDGVPGLSKVGDAAAYAADRPDAGQGREGQTDPLISHGNPPCWQARDWVGMHRMIVV